MARARTWYSDPDSRNGWSHLFQAFPQRQATPQTELQILVFNEGEDVQPF